MKSAEGFAWIHFVCHYEVLYLLVITKFSRKLWRHRSGTILCIGCKRLKYCIKIVVVLQYNCLLITRFSYPYNKRTILWAPCSVLTISVQYCELLATALQPAHNLWRRVNVTYASGYRYHCLTSQSFQLQLRSLITTPCPVTFTMLASLDWLQAALLQCLVD